MRKQNKKNLRQRAGRLHISVNNIVKYGIALEYVGSLSKGAGEVEAKSDGSYDLDINFIIKTNDSAKEVREIIYDALKRNLRDHETILNKTRVIRIVVDRDGYKYNFDIAIKNLETSKVATKSDGGYQWMK